MWIPRLDFLLLKIKSYHTSVSYIPLLQDYYDVSKNTKYRYTPSYSIQLRLLTILFLTYTCSFAQTSLTTTNTMSSYIHIARILHPTNTTTHNISPRTAPDIPHYTTQGSLDDPKTPVAPYLTCNHGDFLISPSLSRGPSAVPSPLTRSVRVLNTPKVDLSIPYPACMDHDAPPKSYLQC